MRWFSHRRSLSPPSGHAMVSSVAACCVPPTAQALGLLCIVNDSAIFVHCVLQTVLFIAQTITFMYTFIVISSAICPMS